MQKKNAFSLLCTLIALFYTPAVTSLAAAPAQVINPGNGNQAPPKQGPGQPKPIQPTDREIRARIGKVAQELNSAEQSLNYWGKVAMSAPVFILNKGQFKMTFDEGISNYVAAAQGNVSGEFRTAVETSTYLGAAGQAQLTAPISLGKAPATNANSPSNPPALPTQAENAFSSFTPLLTLGASGSALI
jgi:hypothetical protein